MRNGERIRLARFCILLAAALLIVASAGPVWAETIHCKDGRRLEGAIVAESPGQVEVVTSAGIRVTIPSDDIQRIEYDYDRAVVESLDPAQPGKYFDLGRELSRSPKQSAQELGRQLIRRAIFLDKDKHYVSGHLLLADLESQRKDGNPSAYYQRVLLLDPDNVAARDKLDQRVRIQSLRPSPQLTGYLQTGVRAYLGGRAADAMAAFGKVPDAPPSLSPPVRLESLTQHCQRFLKTLCAACKGTGKVSCRLCSGTKNVNGFAWFGWLRDNAKQREVNCPRCEKVMRQDAKPSQPAAVQAPGMPSAPTDRAGEAPELPPGVPSAPPSRTRRASPAAPDAPLTVPAMGVLGCPYCGGQRKVSFKRFCADYACGACGGDGKTQSTQQTTRRCGRCGGTGRRSSGIGLGTTACSSCGGDGQLTRTITVPIRCNSCNGTGLRSSKEQLEAQSIGACFQCSETGVQPCGPCKGNTTPFDIPAETRTKLEDYLRALESRDALALHGPKMPLFGELQLDEEEDYSRLFFKGGGWHKEKPADPKED